MADLVYEASDYNAGLPVAVAEVDALLARSGKPISKDERKTVHFLQRVKETIDSLNVDVAHLRRRVDELSTQRTRRGVPTTLNPTDALRFADPAEIESVVDKLSRQRLTTLRYMVSQVEEELEVVSGVRSRLESVLADLLEEEAVSSEVAQRIQEVLEDLPAEVSSSHVLAPDFFHEEDSQWESENEPEKAAVIARALDRRQAKFDDAVDELVSAPEVELKLAEEVLCEPEQDDKPGSEDRPEPPTLVSEPGLDTEAEEEGLDEREIVASTPSQELAAVPPPMFAVELTAPARNPFEKGGWADDIIAAGKTAPDKDTSTTSHGEDLPQTPPDAEPAGADLGGELFETPTEPAGADLGGELFEEDSDLGGELFETPTDPAGADLGGELFEEDSDLGGELFEEGASANSPTNPFARGNA